LQKAKPKANIIPIRFSKREIEKIDKMLEKSGSRTRSEFIREAVHHYIDTVAEMKVISIREIGKEEAKREILEYLKRKDQADTFDIANDLKFDINLTVESLRELWEEGKVV
jgi:metal-responsive CopG/Arc/MetJ family transcriptional regulator